MALNRDRLSCVGSHGGNGPRIWTYKTADTHAQTDAANYFQACGDILRLGDIIHVLVVTNIDASNEAVSTYGSHLVNSRSGPSAGLFTIDITNVTAGSVIDSD